MKYIFIILLTSSSLFACTNPSESNEHSSTISISTDSLKVAYFASGCFWCVEAIYESVKGVEEAVSGYSGGQIKNPSYSQVSAGKTKHAEAVKVFYNPKIVSYETLVDVFFNSHDPTTVNRQGPDSGPQYRSIAFYQNDKEKTVIKNKISTLLARKEFDFISTEVVKFEVFYDAEDYHQDYEKKHPNNSYVKRVSLPRIEKFKKKMPEILK